MIETKEFVNDLEIIASSTILALPSDTVAIKFYDLALLVKFKIAQKSTSKPLDLDFPSEKEMYLTIEIVPEQTGALQELYQLAEDVSRKLYLLFRTDVAHNGQVLFSYNIYEKKLVLPSDAKQQKKSHGK